MTDSRDHNEVVVERVQVPAWRRELLLDATHDAELLIMPVEVRDGRGVYRDADLPAVNALRAAGVRADWAHPASERTFRSTFGADLPTVIVMFIVQALGEHSVAEVASYVQTRVRQALGHRPPGAEPPTFTVEIDRLVRDGDRLEVEGMKVTGSDERVAEGVASMLRGIHRRDEHF